MIVLRRIFMLFCLVVSIIQVGYAQRDVVVEIWTVKESRQHSLGTGFFFGDSTAVLTCYHVIRGAKEIRVAYRPDRTQPPDVYTDVLVRSYSPDHDLALLKIGGITKANPFVRPVVDAPSWREGQEMTIYGHPHGLFYSHLRAYPTHSGYVVSKDVTDRKLAPIFNLNDVNLVMLEGRIYGGMSGGPVLFEGGCIGVLSGCKHEGGTIAWAIPCIYATPERMISVNKTPRDITNWPPLRLMRPDRATLIQNRQIERGVQNLLDEYFAEIETLITLNDEVNAHAIKALACIQSFRLFIEGGLSSGGHPSEVMNNPAYKHLKNETNKYWKAMDETWYRIADSRLKLHACMERLESETRSFSKALPRTQKNDELGKEYISLAEPMRREIVESGKRTKELEQSMQNVLKAMGKTPATLEEMNTYFKTMEAYPSAILRPSSRRDRVARLRVFRSLGYLWQRIFAEDYDTPEMDWVFTCNKGYSMVIPAGWQIDLWPDTPDSAPVDSDLRKGGLEPCLYINNGIDEDLTDTVCAAICTFSSQMESALRDKRPEWFQTTVNEVAGGRDIEIHREGAILYSAVPVESGKKYTYFAMAALPEKTVYLKTLPFDRKYLDTVRRAVPAMASSMQLTK
jgi:hypothetical protein